jgi:inosine/xanthosine triphosphatase
MKKIAIGTTNPAKIAAVQAVFSHEHYLFVPTTVSSDVAAQPFSDEETRLGAVNRAKNALAKEQADIGIGLEGGVVKTNDGLWVCNWGALVDRNGIVVSAGGARIPLPAEVAEGVMSGRELGDVMDEYTGKRNIRKKEGAIGIFTNGYVNRTDMFIHIVKLLAGQYEFFCQNG